MGLPEPLHISVDGTIWYDQVALDRYRSFPRCKFPGCQEHIWYKNSHIDNAHPEVYREYCFTCAFWLHKADELEEFDSARAIIVVLKHGELDVYSYDKDGPLEDVLPNKKYLLGYGGHIWRVEWLSGEVVITNNLWHNGTVPKRFYDRFPVNARLQSAEPKIRSLTNVHLLEPPTQD